MLRVHRALRPALLRPQFARCSNQAVHKAAPQAEVAKCSVDPLTAKRSMLVKAVVGITIGAVTSPFIIGSSLNWLNEWEIRRRIANGADVPEPEISTIKDIEVPRTTDATRLKKELSATYGSFVLVQGPHSQGKTTLVRQALHKMDGGRIYVSVPKNGTLPGLVVEIGKVMRFNPNSWYRDPPLQTLLYGLWKALMPRGKPQSDDWRLYKEKLIEIAKEYKKAHRRAPILVIDNAHTMAQKDPEALDQLQSFAKMMADEKLIVVVFVASDGRAMQMTSSNVSRIRVIQGTDISLDQAKTTLVKAIQAARRRALEKQQAKHKTQPAQEAAVQVDQAEVDHDARRIDDFVEQIVCQYTGGRVGLVFQAANKLFALFERKPQIPFEEAKREVMAHLSKNVGLTNDARFETIEARTLMNALLEKHRNLPKDQQRDIVSTTLTMAEARTLNGLNSSAVRELCSGNMFWLRDGKELGEQLISFQSACAASIAECDLKRPEPQSSLAEERPRTKA